MTDPVIAAARSWRGCLARRLADTALRLCPEYAAFIHGAIRYGLNAAARDVREGREAPPAWEKCKSADELRDEVQPCE